MDELAVAQLLGALGSAFLSCVLLAAAGRTRSRLWPSGMPGRLAVVGTWYLGDPLVQDEVVHGLLQQLLLRQACSTQGKSPTHQTKVKLSAAHRATFRRSWSRPLRPKKRPRAKARRASLSSTPNM